jgi:hypothetical protein
MWKIIVSLFIVIFLFSVSLFFYKKNYTNKRTENITNNEDLNKKLIYITNSNNLQDLEVLLKKGANPNYKSNHKNNELEEIRVSHGISDKFSLLFCDDFNEVFEDYRNSFVIERLKEDFNITDKDIHSFAFNYPLFISIKNKNIETFKLLIKYGAKINIRSILGTPLVLASKLDFYDVVEYLLFNKKKYYKSYEGMEELKEAMRVDLLCSHENSIRKLLLFMKNNNIKLTDYKYFNKFTNYFDSINNFDLYHLFLDIYSH